MLPPTGVIRNGIARGVVGYFLQTIPLILCLPGVCPGDDALPADELQRLVTGTRRVVNEIARVSRERAQNNDDKLEKDKLTERYVRAAALAARELPDDLGPKSFLLGLAVACDHGEFLHQLPVLGEIAQQVETNEERRSRLKDLGLPTILDREDLAQHFLVSAYLTALAGPTAAHAAGVAKEFKDADGRSGFSFIDLAADRAGVQFASDVLEKKVSLADLAKQFVIDDYMPGIDGFVEGLSSEEFRNQFGSIRDERYRKVVEDIDHRIKMLRE
jgi:hypothetical protein